MSISIDSSAQELIGALREVLARVAEPELVLSTVLRQAIARTGAKRGVFVQVVPGGSLDFRVLHGYRADLLRDPGHYSRSVFSACLGSGEDVLLANAAADPRFQGSGSVERLQLASVLCMPIRSGDRVAALVHLEHPQPGYFTESHRGLARALLEIAAPVLEALEAGSAVMRDRERLEQSERRFREEAEESREVLAHDWSFGRFVGRSPAVLELEAMVIKAAGSNYPVLLLGETGTGKSILARVIHSIGPRARQPLVTVFCPSLEKSMVEAELFGHRRGSFTGAVNDRMGKVQAAEKGTLFLDEIGELPLEIQPKLLRLLQEKTYERLGDTQERQADVRVIAATNRDLELEVQEGRFRRDLFERLNFIPVRVPPLRERPEDIPALLRHCLGQTSNGRRIELGDGALGYLRGLDFAWPGNVRHIEQLAARLGLEEWKRPVAAEDLRRMLDLRESPAKTREAVAIPVTSEHQPARPASSALDLDAGLPRLLLEAEKAWLQEAVRRYPRLTRAELADKLKISESALYKKLRLHEIGD